MNFYKNERWNKQIIIEENCAHLVLVNPRYTSQECSSCGAVHESSRDGAKFSCVVCGHLEDADINASKNIMARGIYSISTQKSKRK